MGEMQVQSLGWEDPLETEMTAHTNYSRPENPTDRGAWQAAIHGVTKESDVAWQLNKNGKHIGLQESSNHAFLQISTQEWGCWVIW